MDEMNPLHPELDAFRSPGGLFDVPPCDLDANIGRRCRIIDPKCPADHDIFTIATVQKNYRGDICYRIVGDTDNLKFGKVAAPDEITLI